MSESDSRKEPSQQLKLDEFIIAGDWSTLESICTEGLKVDAHKVKLFVYRGNARYHQKKISEALDDYKAALALDPLNRRASLGIARVHMHDNRVEEAEDIVRNTINNDIEDPEAHELFKQIALRKFRGLIAATRAATTLNTCEESCKAICSKGTDHLTKEELICLKLKFIKNWSDRFDNQECDGSLNNEKLMHMSGMICYELNDLKNSLTCFYIALISILEGTESITIGKSRVLLDITTCYIDMENFESARKIVKIALCIEDPMADPEVKLNTRIKNCELRIIDGDYYLQIPVLKQISREAEAGGLSKVFSAADKLIRTAMAQNNSLLEMPLLDRVKTVRQYLDKWGTRVSEEHRSDYELFLNSWFGHIAREFFPTATENSRESRTGI